MRSSFIARAQLFGNPTRALGRISPGGRWLSWLAPERGVLNIWVAPVGHMRDAQVITTDRQRGVRFHAWANSSAFVLYIQDEGGTEDWHVYAVPVGGGPARDLTPLRGVNARILELGFDEPNVIAVAIFAARLVSAKPSSMPATSNGAARCIRISSTRRAGR